MTIITNGRNRNSTKEFVVVGVGGAGSKSAMELSKVLGNPDDVIAVDREMDALSSINVGRRISIGYPVYVGEDDLGEDDLADPNDLFRLKTLIGKSSIVFVMAGLGGATTMELMPSVLRTAISTNTAVLAIVTLPFEFEGRTRTDTAKSALHRIKETGCSLAQIDADGVLSTGSIAGDLAAELTASKARVVMNVLSASNASATSALNTAPEMLDAIKCGGETFISYASGADVDEIRRVARQAIKSPITSGLELCDAEFVSVVVAGPREMSTKSLNASISIVQSEIASDAVLSTSFVPNDESTRSRRIRVSVLGGLRPDSRGAASASKGAFQETGLSSETVIHSGTLPQDDELSGQIDDLFGAPDWLNGPSEKEPATTALL